MNDCKNVKVLEVYTGKDASIKFCNFKNKRCTEKPKKCIYSNLFKKGVK